VNAAAPLDEQGVALSGGVWDVIVVGAGPAGCACAIRCAAAGARTLLLDAAQPGRDRVCGCCLSAKALTLLGQLRPCPLDDQAVAPQPLRQLALWREGRCASFAVPPGAAVSRRVLDAALLRCARAAGAVVRCGAAARLLQRPAALPVVALADGPQLRARVVVAATGCSDSFFRDVVGAPLRVPRHALLGLACDLPQAPAAIEPGAIHMGLARRGYAGLVRLEDGSARLAAAVDPRDARRLGGAAPLVQRILEEAMGRPVATLSGLRFHGKGRLTRSRPCALGRTLLAGDCALFVEPFTGEGIAWALESGLRVAAHALAGAERWSDSVAQAWRAEHEAVFGPPRRRCALVGGALRRPGLGAALCALARTSPALAAAAGRVVWRTDPA